MAGINSQPSKTVVDTISNIYLAPLKMLCPGVMPGAGMANLLPVNPLAFYSKASLEIMGLATRRTQALMDASAKTTKCRNTGDLVNVATEFWQTAWAQQLDSANKIAAMFGAATPALAVNPAPARDVITVPESARTTAKDPAAVDRSNWPKRAA
jgi:hypothetical protein